MPHRVGPAGVAVAVWLAVSACADVSARRGYECIAPANPGGGWDRTCRVLGTVLAELDLVPGALRVTNMPGAGGGIAFAHAVAQRSGDARVVIAASPATTLRLAERQYSRLTERDVRWLAALGAEYGVLAVGRDAPWADLETFVAAWRARPEAVAFGGGSAVAGQDHMKVLLLARRAGIDPRRVRYVPFDGGGEAMTALLGGFVRVFSGELSEIEGQLEAGTIRLLTVLAPERLDGAFADVPTAREAGYDVEWITWRGFYVPAGISDSAYGWWVRAMTRVAESDAWVHARRVNRLRPFFRAGPEFEAFVHEQVAEFRALAIEIGLIK